MKSYDVTGFSIKNINCKLTLDIKIIKTLEILRRYGFFHQKYQLQTDIRHPNQQATWNPTTLRVFSIKNINCKQTLDIKIIKTLEILRRYGFFHQKCQLQTDIRHQNHQNTWNPSTLRVFPWKISIANWHQTSKSSNHLKSFDVTGISIKNCNCKLTSDIKIIKTLEILRRYGFFHQKCQLQTDIRHQNHQNTWNPST